MIFLSLILREIHFGDSRSSKTAILTHFEALNLDFHELLHFLKADIFQINKIQSLENGKNGSFRASKFTKIDFTQNLSIKKFVIFHTV